MSDLRESLKREFKDEDYRYAYAESFLNTKLAAQIKTLREQRRETQAQVATRMGITQPGYRRFEDVNHSVWKTDSLWEIAKAYGVRLNVSFETFGSLLDEKERFNKKALKRVAFENDPAFKDATDSKSESAFRELLANVGKPVVQDLPAETISSTGTGAVSQFQAQADKGVLTGNPGTSKVIEMPKRKESTRHGRAIKRAAKARKRSQRRIRRFLREQCAV